MKKLTSILLALLMALTLLPTAIFAEDSGSKTQQDGSVAYIVGGAYYTALDTAVNAVGNNKTATIKLLKNATGSGFAIPENAGKNITIDFGGFTFTINGLVGSTGTETNGMQLNKGNTVTLKNGTLNVDNSVKNSAAALVQNYCDFTAEYVTFDGTNLLNANQAYVLSNNHSKINIVGCTIIAPERANSYALDAAIWGTYAGADVTAENCTIYGKMEVAEWSSTGGWHKVNPVAKVNGLPLLTLKNCAVTDLASAMLCAADGATIKLAGDVTVTEEAKVTKDLTIDLNGYKLSESNGNAIVDVIEGATLIIDGTIQNSEVYGRINVGIGADSATNNNGNVVLNGGTYKCGTGENNKGQTVLHINGNSHNSSVTIKGATITSPNDNGIQLNGGGEFLIENSTITGATAVYVKSGKLTVTGSTLIGNKSPVDYKYYGNGANATGDGIVIDSCDYPAGAPTVTIENTTVTGSKAAVGVYEYLNTEKATAATHTNATVTLESGTFTGNSSYGAVANVIGDGLKASNITITGGTFNTNPAAYVDDSNYAVTKGTDGKYTVAKVASNNSTSSVVLPSSTTTSGTTTSTTATIPATDVDANKELVVKNDKVSVTLNDKAVQAAGTESNLSLTVTTKEAKNNTNVDEANKTAYANATKNTTTTNAVVVTIDLKANNQNVFTSNANNDTYAIVKVPYKANMKEVTVQHLDANGTFNKLTAANSANLTQNNTFYYDSTTGDITMRLPHFSQYLINGSVQHSYINRYNSGAVTTDKAESPKTFDAGVAIYGVMAVSSVLGMGYMGKKKFF